jgi:hypothetical protein
MNMKRRVAVLLCMFALVAYDSYRTGYLEAASKAAKERAAEYGNDWNSDPSVKHSGSYEMGYARGRGIGWAEARQQAFTECGENLLHRP